VVARRYARYGPPDRYPSPPSAGLCVSVFAILQDRRRIVIGVCRKHPRWIREWYPQFQSYTEEELSSEWRIARIPSVYLREGEHPDHALRRILRDQLRVKRFSAKGPEVRSYTGWSDWYPGHRHWDLCFVYRVKAKLPRNPGPWWSWVDWRDTKALRPKDFGWNLDFARDLRIARA
jgi:hypothetical protein